MIAVLHGACLVVVGVIAKLVLPERSRPPSCGDAGKRRRVDGGSSPALGFYEAERADGYLMSIVAPLSYGARPHDGKTLRLNRG